MRASRSRRIRLSGLLAAILVTYIAAPAVEAHADTITPTNFSVSVDRTQVVENWGQTITTTVSFTTPNSAVAGDTLTLTLPEVLTDWPPSFAITNGDGGPVVYEVTISDTDPAVATFTLTEAGAAVDNLSVTADFGATVGHTPGGTYPLTYVLNSSTSVISAGSVVVTTPTYEVPSEPSKSAWFTNNGDQCRTQIASCLTFQVATTGAPRGTITIRDDAQGTWEHACLAIKVEVVTFTAAGGREWNRLPDINPGDSGYTCSAESLSLAFNAGALNLAENQIVTFQFLANALDVGGDGLVTYENRATVTINDKTTTPGKDVTSSYVGGSATGDAIAIIKRDSHGHDANTTEEAVELTDGTADLSFTIVNRGTTTLTDIKVSDEVTSGTGAVTDLTCDFSPLGGPGEGTTWDGPFAPHASFTCTAKLVGVIGPHTDTATVTATGNGSVRDDDDYNAVNEPRAVDNPMNLVLTKKLTTQGPFNPGQVVRFTLTPSNDNEADAAAGWSVTDKLPKGLTLVGMSGDGYDCTDNTCVADEGLAAGATGNPITVTARIDADASGKLHNVAYVSPRSDDIPESNPLAIPATTTDTDDTDTDNDAQADLLVAATPSAAAATTSATSGSPTDSANPPGEAAADTSQLAESGASVGVSALVGALTLIGVGVALMLRKRSV